MVKIKSRQIIWDELAVKQLNDYLEYANKQSPSAPKIIKEGVLDRIKAIKLNPYIFEADKLKETNNGNYRAFIIYNYRITYKIIEKQIHILRIRHTSKEPLEYK